MKINYRLIGQRVKQKRKTSQKTQDKLAEALGVSVGYISQVERGVTKISLDTLAEIATILQCDVTELIVGSAPRQEEYLTRELTAVYKMMDAQQKTMLLDIANIIVRRGCDSLSPPR